MTENATNRPTSRTVGAGSRTDPQTGSAKLPRRLRRIYALEDLEEAARRHLPRPIFGYVEGGAETNSARDGNRSVFDEIQFLPRYLVDVSARDISTSLFGRHYAMPVGIAPMGVCALTGYRGDIALARAAARADVPMVISAASLIRLEDIAAANPDVWYQAYLSPDQTEIKALLDRVAAAGIGTFMITVDTAVMPLRENNLRTGYRTPIRPSLALLRDGITHPSWALGTFLRTFLQHGNPHFENAGPGRGAPLLSRQAVRDFSGRQFLDWSTVSFIRRHWCGKLVVKGLLHPEDIARASVEGVDGVVLSNHGGRQLDYVLSSMRVLPAARAVAGDMTVMIDGGFRRGTDVLKALALGADFVFVGRPFNYAAAIAGEAGVTHALDLMRQQLLADLGMLGLVSLAQMGREHLFLKDFRTLPTGTDEQPD